MRSEVITLSAEEVAYADGLGHQRQDAAVENNREAAHGAPTEYAKALALHITGARAETAAKRWLEPIEWHRRLKGFTGMPDLGDDIDVKGVEVGHYRLLLPPEPKPNFLYLLVRGHNHPTWIISGWIDGAQALLNPDWLYPLKPGRLSFNVPNENLRPLKECWEYVERWYPGDRR